MTTTPHCRACGQPLGPPVFDLGSTPLANSLLKPEQLNKPEPTFPLRIRHCEGCHLVQADDFAAPEDIFSDYVYFSSWSTTWLAHAKTYAEKMVARFGLSTQSFVVEIASNDGYLLQNFVTAQIPCLGVEPAVNVAEVARTAGVPTEVAFFGRDTAERLVDEHGQADLVAANNVLAHVPDVDDFLGGFSALLKPDGVVTFEFPSLLNLVKFCQFDTIYHEHFSYLSLVAVQAALARHGLHVFDVEDLPTHGGSYRLYVAHEGSAHEVMPAVSIAHAAELKAGLDQSDTFRGLAARAEAIRDALLAYLRNAKTAGYTVAAYGAAAKGNTFLNYCGIGTDLISFVVDRSTEKQGRYLPGSRIPVLPPEAVFDKKPDALLILPWNLKGEIMADMSSIREWGGKFVIAIPELEVL